MPIWSRRRTAIPSWSICADGRCRNRGRCVLGRETAIQPVAGPTDGWLYTSAAMASPPLPPTSRTSPPCPWPRRRRSARVRRARPADRLPMAPHPRAGRDLQPHRPPRPSPPVRPREHRQPVRPGAGRAAATGILLLRLLRDGVYARAFPAGRRAGRYYNGAKFHYLHVSHDEQIGRHIRVMSALPDSPQADAFTHPDPDPRRPHRAARRSRLRTPPLRLAPGRRDWIWLREIFDASDPLRRSHRAGRCPISPARLSAWRAGHVRRRLHADFDWFEYRERDYVAEVEGD
jgi:xylan 1,4-beta-xylosidase